jgi:hypothetical protein
VRGLALALPEGEAAPSVSFAWNAIRSNEVATLQAKVVDLVFTAEAIVARTKRSGPGRAVTAAAAHAGAFLAVSGYRLVPQAHPYPALSGLVINLHFAGDDREHFPTSFAQLTR